MDLVYVDESGDPGRALNSSRYFILCGLAVHHADWQIVRRQLEELRERLADLHGLCPKAEIHTAEFLSNSRDHLGLNQRQRIQCLLHLLGFLERTPLLKPIRAWIDKSEETNDPLVAAWLALIMKARVHAERAQTHSDCLVRGLMIISDDLRPAPGSR